MKKNLDLYDGVVNFEKFEITLHDGKNNLKISREDNEKHKKRRRPEASGP